jgi:hypothetical protein
MRATARRSRLQIWTCGVFRRARNFEVYIIYQDQIIAGLPVFKRCQRRRLVLESDLKVHEELQSFRSISRIEANWRNAIAVRLRYSQSLASLRQRSTERFSSSVTPVG